jgi:hypothetical protein
MPSLTKMPLRGPNRNDFNKECGHIFLPSLLWRNDCSSVRVSLSSCFIGDWLRFDPSIDLKTYRQSDGTMPFRALDPFAWPGEGCTSESRGCSSAGL